MKHLLELAKNIKDKKLRKDVEGMLKDFRLSNKDFDLPKSDINKTPAGTGGFHHCQEGGLIQHTQAVTEMCMKCADVVEKVYSIKLNRDYLIAGALLHDIAKVYEYVKANGAWGHSGIKFDHSFMIGTELYARGFPEELVHIVESHLGQSANPPRTMEALILHHIDTLDAIIGSSTEENLLHCLLNEG